MPRYMHWQNTQFSNCQLIGMKKASENTENTRSVIVQNTEVCQLGEVSYNLASALIGADGYDLTDEFKNAIRLLPSQYSAAEYTRFLDNWGTVSLANFKLVATAWSMLMFLCCIISYFCAMHVCCLLSAHN